MGSLVAELFLLLISAAQVDAGKFVKREENGETDPEHF